MTPKVIAVGGPAQGSAAPVVPVTMQAVYPPVTPGARTQPLLLQPPGKAPPAGQLDFLEDGDKVEKWLSAEATRGRRERLGLDEADLSSFVQAREFVSLGCFCGVARALQAIGMKRFAYPFDWVRAPCDGVIHCLDNAFEDFLSFTAMTQPTFVKQPVFTSAQWGGSFWHHDPSAPATAGDFMRRAERFMGLREVAPDGPRVFVRAINCTRELALQRQLLVALRRALPKSEVRLLVLVDFQRSSGLRALAEVPSDELLFSFVHEDLFGLNADKQPQWTMERQSEAYADAIGLACKFWAGRPEAASALVELPDLSALAASCTQWDGGCPANELFYPRRFQGSKITMGAATTDTEGEQAHQQLAQPQKVKHIDGKENLENQEVQKASLRETKEAPMSPAQLWLGDNEAQHACLLALTTAGGGDAAAGGVGDIALQAQPQLQTPRCVLFGVSSVARGRSVSPGGKPPYSPPEPFRAVARRQRSEPGHFEPAKEQLQVPASVSVVPPRPGGAAARARLQQEQLPASVAVPARRPATAPLRPSLMLPVLQELAAAPQQPSAVPPPTPADAGAGPDAEAEAAPPNSSLTPPTAPPPQRRPACSPALGGAALSRALSVPSPAAPSGALDRSLPRVSLPPPLLSDVAPPDEVQVVDLVVPTFLAPGGALQTTAFGQWIQIVLPEGAQPGQLLRLQLSNGLLTCDFPWGAAPVAG